MESVQTIQSNWLNVIFDQDLAPIQQGNTISTQGGNQCIHPTNISNSTASLWNTDDYFNPLLIIKH